VLNSSCSPRSGHSSIETGASEGIVLLGEDNAKKIAVVSTYAQSKITFAAVTSEAAWTNAAAFQ